VGPSCQLPVPRRLNWTEAISRAQWAPTKGPSLLNQRLGTVHWGPPTGGLVRPGEPVVGYPTHPVMPNLVMLWKMSPLRGGVRAGARLWARGPARLGWVPIGPKPKPRGAGRRGWSETVAPTTIRYSLTGNITKNMTQAKNFSNSPFGTNFWAQGVAEDRGGRYFLALSVAGGSSSAEYRISRCSGPWWQIKNVVMRAYSLSQSRSSAFWAKAQAWRSQGHRGLTRSLLGLWGGGAWWW
jgi:hypothetical protein